MCGITGIFQRQGSVEPELLQSAIQSLAHRGPDDSGSYRHESVGLGHSRLSIIGLDSGHQPMTSVDGNLTLIANGEIYNYIELRALLESKGHQFVTSSDSEVILHGYREFGEEVLSRLNGMFAFALYDRQQKTLLLARDRLGIKPLFIAYLSNGIAFASELKALYRWMPGKPEVDPQGLMHYLQNQFSSGTDTLVRSVERLLPAEALVLKNGQIEKRWSYWSATELETQQIDQPQAIELFDSLFETVMKEHMRSDVPFGLFLSGGVDSAILLAMLTEFSDQPIRTFSVGFAGTKLVDELPLANQIAKHFNSDHTEFRPNQQDIFQVMPLTVWSADELMRDYANLPVALLAEAAGKELKVVFSGEGGDEVFAGYGRYRASSFENTMKGLIYPGSGGYRTSATLRGRAVKRLFGDQLLAVNAQRRAFFVEAWKSAPKHWSAMQKRQWTDIRTSLPDNLLVKADRLLMASALEGRVPFLDHRIVEFGLSLPDSLKLVDRQGKWLLKKWAEKRVPKSHLYAKKRGFHVPVGEWMQGEYRQKLCQRLPQHPAIKEWFRPEGVKQLLAGYGSSGAESRMVWAMLQFAVWHELFINGDGSRPDARTDPLELIA